MSLLVEDLVYSEWFFTEPSRGKILTYFMRELRKKSETSLKRYISTFSANSQQRKRTATIDLIVERLSNKEDMGSEHLYRTSRESDSTSYKIAPLDI